MKLSTEAKITQLIELTKENDEKEYMILTDNEWKTVTQEEYNNILKGE